MSPNRAFAKDNMFFSSIMNSILIGINVGLMAAVAFLFYAAYPVLIM